jgi:RNA methyltransferase, TrmH family
MRPDRSPLPIVVSSLGLRLSPDLIHQLREREFRDRHSLFFATGTRFLVRAVDNGCAFAGLLVCRSRLNPVTGTIVKRIRDAGTPVVDISPREMDLLSGSTEPQATLSVHPQLWQELPARVSRQDLWLGLESIRTPGNLGTLLRSAEAAGATGIFGFGRPSELPDPFDPAAVRASMGSLFALRFVRTSHREFRKWKLRYELKVIGADGAAGTDYRAVSLRRSTLLLLGHERSGLSDAQRATCDGFVKIPMDGSVDSLNLAMAGTVLLFEARNQRHPVKRR